MAQELPRYIARTPIQPGPFTSSAPAFEALAKSAGAFQAITETKARKQAAQQAIIRGEEAGMQPGFQSVKGTGESTQLFNKSALQANKLMLGKQISIHLKELKQQTANDFPDSNQAIIAYKNQAQQYSEELLQNIPKENDAYAKNLLMYHASVGLTGLQKNANAQNKLKTFIEYTDTSAQAKEDFLNALHRGNVSEALTLAGQKRQVDEMALLSGVIKQKEFDRIIKDDQLDFNKDLINEGYRQALLNGKGDQFIKSAQNKRIPGMNDQEAASFFSSLSKVRNNLLQTNGINKAEVAKQSKDEIIAVRAGGKPNQKLREKVVLINNENGVRQYDEDVEDAQIYHNVVSTARNLPFSMQDKFVDQFRPRDANDPDFARKRRNFDAMINGINEFQDQMYGPNADPIAVLSQHPEIVEATVQQKNIETLQGTGQLILQNPNVSINPTLMDLNNRLINTQLQLEIPIQNARLLTNEQAKGMIAAIRNSEPEDQVIFFSSLKNKYKDNYPRVFNDLVRQKLPSSMQFLSQVDPTSPIILDIQESLQIPLKTLTEEVDKKKQASIDLAIEQEDGNIGNYVSTFKTFRSNNSIQYANAFKNYIKQVAYTLSIKDKSLSAKDAISQATDSITYQFNFEDIDNTMIRIPFQYNAKAVKKYARQQEKFLDKFPFVLKRSSEGLPNRKKIEMEQIIKPGHWANVSDNQNLVYVDVHGHPVADIKGNMFSISFKNAVEGFASDYGSFGYYERSTAEKFNSVAEAILSTEEMKKAGALLSKGTSSENELDNRKNMEKDRELNRITKDGY